MAIVQIKKLKISAILGTKPEERIKKQDIFLDITFEYNAADAISTDNVLQAVDYEKLAISIKNSLSSSKFFLLEKMAEFALEIVFQDPRVTSATAQVLKPNALKNAKHVAVTLSRKR